MIDLEPKDYKLAQKLLDSVDSLDNDARVYWTSYIISYSDVESKNVLESTASAIKGLGEFWALYQLAAKIVHDKDYQHEWRRYCEVKDKDLKVEIVDCPSLDLHMRLFEETKCFLFEYGNWLFDILPGSDIKDIEIALEDPGAQKLRDIYHRFGNGKQAPNKPIVEIVQGILNVYKIRSEVVGERLLKLPVEDFLMSLVAATLLEDPNAVKK